MAARPVFRLRAIRLRLIATRLAEASSPEGCLARHAPGSPLRRRTSDVERRLQWHNTGPSGVTVHHRPWSLVVALEFADATTAVRFERSLKTGSGRAFAKRHFGGEKHDEGVRRASARMLATQSNPSFAMSAF